MEKIKIQTEFIKLSQLIKWLNITESGGAAKHLISEGLVKVNGEVETKKGRKLYPGDEIEIADVGNFLVE